MGACFLCDAKLYGEKTRVCSSVMPHSNVPCAEKIAELMGEEFVVIVTPADHLCKKCSSLMTQMDKWQNDSRIIQDTLVSYIQKKYGILSPDEPVKVLDIVNGQLRVQLEVGQKRVPSGLNLQGSSGNTASKKIKLNCDNIPKMKVYKCGFCAFQSKELGHVRFHMRTHVEKKDIEKAVQIQTRTQEAPNRQQKEQQRKKKLYKCQVCAASFETRETCLDHINVDHNQLIPATNAEAACSSRTETRVLKPVNTLKTNGNQQAVDVDGEQGNIGAVNTAVLLNGNIVFKRTVAEKQDDSKEDKNKEEPVEEATHQVEQTITDIVKAAIESFEINGQENKTEDLDIESMLAAIHNDPPSNA